MQVARLGSKWVDILSAIQRVFSAIIDAKGKLAQYFLYRQLDESRRKSVIKALVNYSGLLRGQAADQNSWL